MFFLANTFQHLCEIRWQINLINIYVKIHDVKLCQVAGIEGESGESLMIPYRYDVAIQDAGRTNCFKPNPLPASCDHLNHKPNTLGAVYLGEMGRVAKQKDNKIVSLVWEVPNRVILNLFDVKVPWSFLQGDPALLSSMSLSSGADPAWVNNSKADADQTKGVSYRLSSTSSENLGEDRMIASILFVP